MTERSVHLWYASEGRAVTIGSQASAMSQIVSKFSTSKFDIASLKETIFGSSTTLSSDGAGEAQRAHAQSLSVQKSQNTKTTDPKQMP